MPKGRLILSVHSFLRECCSEKVQNFLLRNTSFSKGFLASELSKEEGEKKKVLMASKIGIKSIFSNLMLQSGISVEDVLTATVISQFGWISLPNGYKPHWAQ